jgi:hypothetical protein
VAVWRQRHAEHGSPDSTVCPAALQDSAASLACAAVCSSRAPQSKYAPPRPFGWLVWQVPTVPQHPVPAQHVAPHTSGLDAAHAHSAAPQVASAGQASPQPPQCCGSVRVSTQRAAVPVPQSVWPVGHRHVPASQAWPAAHRVPQAPQFCGSTARFTHVLPQACGSAGGHWQTPPAHTSFVSGHACAQPPQWRSSVSVFTQAVPQTSGREAGQVHAPAEQISPVLAHRCPQPPQLAGSLRMSVQNAPQSSGVGA